MTDMQVCLDNSPVHVRNLSSPVPTSKESRRTIRNHDTVGPEGTREPREYNGSIDARFWSPGRGVRSAWDPDMHDWSCWQDCSRRDSIGVVEVKSVPMAASSVRRGLGLS